MSSSKFIIAAAAVLALSIPLHSQTNPIVTENSLPGSSGWSIPDSEASGNGDNTLHNGAITGFASATSVNAGQTIGFQVSVYVSPSMMDSIPYNIEIYRMGYYGGAGGRLYKRIYFGHNTSSVGCVVTGNSPLTENCSWAGYVQPYCKFKEAASQLAECPWYRTYNLQVPTTWVSGIYLAKLTNEVSNKKNYIIFVVRNDAAYADFVYQQPVNTYQAYNNFPANPAGTPTTTVSKSLYSSNSYGGTQAYKVSFERPYASGKGSGQFFAWEYYFVKWIEKHGYSVKYTTNVDTHERGAAIGQSLAFLSVGHDEYWTKEMFDNLLALRNGPGTSLAFFGANTSYWKSRYEPSPTAGTASRVLASYKESSQLDTYAADPSKRTGLFKDKYMSEQKLLGVRFVGTNSVIQDYVVANSGHWVWTCAGVQNGSVIKGINGYEVDKAFGYDPGTGAFTDPGERPDGMTGYVLLGDSPYQMSVGTGTQAVGSNSSLYTHLSSSIVFASGTLSWTWPLAEPSDRPEPVNGNWQAIRNATQNILDMMSNRPLSSCNSPG
jgi:hypothetical protein